jgi:hypothetical protein
MIKLIIEKNEFMLADTWNEVNFGQYIDILFIQENKWTDLQKTVKIISAISDKPKELEEVLYKADYEDLIELTKMMSWVNDDFVSISNATPTKDIFTINGKEYVIKKNYNKLALGEMISLETLFNNPNYHQQEIVVAILLREVVDGVESDFNETTFYEILDTLKYEINLVDVYKYITFFLSGDKTSTTNGTRGFSIIKMGKKS